MLFRELKLCSKSRKCDKKNKHSGRCNASRKSQPFWEASRFQVHNRLKREFRESDEQLRADYETKTARFVDLEDREEKVHEKESQAGLYFEFISKL